MKSQNLFLSNRTRLFVAGFLATLIAVYLITPAIRSARTRTSAPPAPLPPTISKAFGAASILLNGTTSLTFTISNPNGIDSLNGISFADNLPAGLVVATPGNVSNRCGGTVTALDGSSAVLFSGG